MSIQNAIKVAGTLSKLSEITGKSIQVIVNWRSRGTPAAEVIPVCEALNWEVTPHQIRPDIYPNKSDGLPSDVSACPNQDSLCASSGRLSP